MGGQDCKRFLENLDLFQLLTVLKDEMGQQNLKQKKNYNKKD